MPTHPSLDVGSCSGGVARTSFQALDKLFFFFGGPELFYPYTALLLLWVLRAADVVARVMVAATVLVDAVGG